MDRTDAKSTEVTCGTTRQHDHSYLFLLRLWTESEDPACDTVEQQQWHGKLQYVLSHNARYFHDWPTLVDLLLVMLPDLELRERIRHAGTDPEDGG